MGVITTKVERTVFTLICNGISYHFSKQTSLLQKIPICDAANHFKVKWIFKNETLTQ